MPEREEVEINIKTTSDTSGVDALRSKLEGVRKETERPLTAAQASQQGLRVASQGELSRSLLTQRDLERRRIEAEYERISNSRPPALFSPARGAIEEARARANQAQLTEQTVTPLGTVTRQIQDFKQIQAEKQRIDKEYATNVAKDRATNEKEELASLSRLFTAHKTQTTEYVKLYNQARKEGRVAEGVSPAGPGGPSIPGNIKDLLADSGGGGGGRTGSGRGLFDINTTSAIRFGAALAGLGVGLSVYYFAGRLIHLMLQDLVKTETEATQATVNLTAAFGKNSQQYNELVKSVATGGTGAGFFKVSDVQQSVSALKPFQDNLRLSAQDMNDLVVAAAKLADIHNIPLTQSTQALAEALSGNAQAAGQLGLSLDDVTVASTAANGQFAGSFGLLTQSEQASLRLAAAQQQVATQFANTKNQLDPLGEATRNFGAAWENIVKSSGITNTFAGAINNVANALRDYSEAATKAQAAGKTNPILNAIAQSLGFPSLDEVKSGIDTIKQAKDALGTAAHSTAYNILARGQTAQLPSIDTIGRLQDIKENQGVTASYSGPSAQALTRIQDLKDGLRDVSGAAQDATKNLALMFARLEQDAPTIQNQVTTITGSVKNVSALTQAQRDAVAVRQAELGVLKQKNLADLQAQAATYGELQGVNQLTSAYEGLISAQSEVNRLQLESTQLQAQTAQAQLNTLALTRAAQNVDLRLQLDRLTATDRLLSAQERAAARRDIRQTIITGTDVQRQAAIAQAQQVLPAQRAEEVNQLLSRIAQASEARAQQVVDINITVNGATVNAGQ